MTGREKIEAAFSGGGASEIPAVICYEGIYIRDHWSQLTSCPWWYAQSPKLEHQLAWRRDFLAATPQDWFALPGCASRAEREAAEIQQRGEDVFLIDRRSGERRKLYRPVVAGWSRQAIAAQATPARLPESVEEIDAAVPLPGEFDGDRFAADGRGDLAEAMLAEFGADVCPTGGAPSPLWRCYGLWGFEGMMTLIAERPDLVERACRRLLAGSIQSVRHAAELGAVAVWIEECLTDMISPAAFERLNLPPLRELIEAIRSAGMKSVYYYCGDPAGKWELLVSAGADALSLEESKKGFTIDIDDVVERVAGRCAVLGNLDAMDLLAGGDEEQLRAEIARQIAAGRRAGGRFIMSLGSPVTPETPPQRVRRYLQLARELGA